MEHALAFSSQNHFGCGGGTCSVRFIHPPSCAMEQIQNETLNTTLDTHSRLGVLVGFPSHFSSKQVIKGMKYVKHKNWVETGWIFYYSMCTKSSILKLY